MKKEETILRIVAHNILAKRKALNLSQEQLAELAGLHRTYIGQVERAEKNITLISLSRIAKALNTPITNILTQK